VRHGMRATAGAIEEVWIDHRTYEPTYETIGGLPARGICGSGMIGLLAEMFITGIVDKAGKIARDLPTPRVRVGDHGGEYVVVWANQSGIGTDIVINEVDIENLLRTKGAIYAGFTVLVRERWPANGRRRAGAHRRRLWAVHQRREGDPDRPAARYALGPISLTWATPRPWAPSIPWSRALCGAR
jgi:hypothetical protein